MDKVADYINEMQRIHDLYSPLFNSLMNQSQHEKVKTIILYINNQVLRKIKITVESDVKNWAYISLR